MVLAAVDLALGTASNAPFFLAADIILRKGLALAAGFLAADLSAAALDLMFTLATLRPAADLVSFDCVTGVFFLLAPWAVASPRPSALRLNGVCIDDTIQMCARREMFLNRE